MLPLLLLALFADAPERCSVSGTVVDSVTGKGLAKVEMALEPFDREAHHVAVSASDAAGRFSIVDVECGDYRLTGRRARYLDARRIVLKLDPGQKADGLTYKLAPAGAIAGTVRDADGEPVPGAHMILAWRSGSQIRGRESTDADDQGNYRFGYLLPGTYYIGAEPASRPWNREDHSPTRVTAPESPILTFYPSAPEVSMASAIVVAPGAQVTGSDITMLRSRVFRVRGIVAGATAAMGLALRAESDLPDIHPSAIARPGGEFEFRNVPPGSYSIATGDAAVRVTVAGADIDGLRLVPGSGGSVSGRVRVEGDATRELTGIVRLRLGDRDEHHLQILRDGAFSARRVTPGKYDVDVRLRRAGDLYVKSIRSGGLDVFRDGIRIGSGLAELEIMLAPAAQVTGTVVDSRGEPVVGGTVVFEPGLKPAVTDQQGRFTIDSLGPGDYRAYAWEDVEEDAWEDPEFLKQYEGERVVVAARERKTFRLRLSSK